ERSDVAMPSLLKRWRLTVDDYHRMAKAGILHEDDRVELIEGELIEMATIGSYHFTSVNNLNQEFSGRSSGRFIVSVQNPVRVSRHSEPRPDIALLRPRADKYAGGLPGPEDVLLIVEVSDPTVAADRRVKLPLYAAAGIPEAWLVNIPRRSIEVHREPRGGRYQQVTVFRKGERIALLLLLDVTVAVEDILP
ncbi:MAG: Uma2 family endonuclease, partial [Dehalococcoidia bacterium]